MIKSYVIAILFVFASCTSLVGKEMSALQYSEFFTRILVTLKPKVEETEKQVALFNSDLQYDSIRVSGHRMRVLIQSKIELVKNTAAPKAELADDFKHAMIIYLQSMVLAYQAYEDYGAAGTQKGRDEILKTIPQKIKFQEEGNEQVQKVQKAFARANGFVVM